MSQKSILILRDNAVDISEINKKVENQKNINIINSNIDEIRQKIVKLETVKAEEMSKIDMGKINEMYKQFEEIKRKTIIIYEIGGTRSCFDYKQLRKKGRI